ncbi:hypothetical protein M8818_003822 [Zalaria obscura]|uniref:Uncharacterized protein n=1 Tax=Zalaria obscura TaxID=2024903 RepID=A0ACC3SDY7_9PEZI
MAFDQQNADVHYAGPCLCLFVSPLPGGVAVSWFPTRAVMNARFSAREVALNDSPKADMARLLRGYQTIYWGPTSSDQEVFQVWNLVGQIQKPPFYVLDKSHERAIFPCTLRVLSFDRCSQFLDLTAKCLFQRIYLACEVGLHE